MHSCLNFQGFGIQESRTFAMSTVLNLIFFITTTVFSAKEHSAISCNQTDRQLVSLSCDPSHWLHVLEERYSAGSPDLHSSCVLKARCQNSLSSHTFGLDVSCNGPVGPSGRCEEETVARQHLNNCIAENDNIAVEVRYECLPGEDVVDMCRNNTNTWIAGQVIYLATPSFPNTPALSQHCSCYIMGNELWMRAFEIQLDVGTSPVWIDMLTVSVLDAVKWSTGHSAGHLKYVQEMLLAPDDNKAHSEATVSYRDYNQPKQLAWIEVKSVGTERNLTIKCESAFVPPPPSATPTTITTTVTTRIATSKPLNSTTLGTITTIKSSPSLISSSQTTMSSAGKRTMSGKEAGKQEAEEGVIVGLSLLAVVLVAVAVTLGIISWRRYQIIKQEQHEADRGDKRSPFILDLRAWCGCCCMRHHEHSNLGAQHFDNAFSECYHLDECAKSVHIKNQGEEHYETADDLDLTLQQIPRSEVQTNRQNCEKKKQAHAPAQQLSDFTVSSEIASKSQTYENISGSETLHKQKDDKMTCESKSQSNLDVQQRPDRPLKSSNHTHASASTIYNTGKETVQNGSFAGEAEDKISSTRKQKFVAKVLEQTLEDVISQREALKAYQYSLQNTDGQDLDINPSENEMPSRNGTEDSKTLSKV